MFKLIQQLFQLLTPSQRKRFYVLQVLVLIMAFGELVGIASIGPFMALVADLNLLQSNAIYHQLYVLTGFSNPNDFLFLTGVVVLLLLGLSSVISIFTTWRLSLFGTGVGMEIADRLYEHYLNQDWLFHAGGSSAQLTKQVATEPNRVTYGIIMPLMQLNSRLVLSVFIAIAVIAYNPVIAFGGLLLFTGGYVLVFYLVKQRLVRNSRNISKTSQSRFRLMNEGFGGIKDIILSGRKQYFIKTFHQEGIVQARAQGTNNAFSLVPRYFMELLAFGAMISLVLVLLKLHNGALDTVLPVLAVYALAGFKLLPALQQIYASLSQIKGSGSAFESIRDDLINSHSDTKNKSQNSAVGKEVSNTHTAINKFDDTAQAQAIVLDNITLTYPNKNKPALENINLRIGFNSVVAFVGESGSGKSTVIDIILALIQPDSGRLIIDGKAINTDNTREWQKHIGFVPQSIFLSEGTIAENIAFGLAPVEIDLERVKTAAKLAKLDELITGLEHGLNTHVGERGVQLSGGQRQRIGIARALYNQAKVLVFDEATSALDGITEKYIMDAIHALSGQRTIIMIAHRLKTVQKCDTIFMLDQGKLVDQGTYDELLVKNSRFNEMAKHA